MAKSTRTAPPKTDKLKNSEDLLSGNTATDEPIVSPLTLLTNGLKKGNSFKSAEDFDKSFNDVEEEEEKDIPKGKPGVVVKDENELFVNKQRTLPGGLKVDLDQLNEVLDDVPLPQIRKVAIKKITRFTFRLGLEKQKMNMIPGTAYTWVCDRKGTEYVTGLEGRPEDRKRLEQALRVKLHPESEFWGTLTFRLEDREHGVILNFDDPQFGAMHEVVYFGMLGSSLIANGYQEYRSGKKPGAEWYIEDKEAEAEAAQADMTSEAEAFEMFGRISFDKRRMAGKLLGLPVWGGSDKVASKILWDYLKGMIDEKSSSPELSSNHSRAFLNIMRKGDAEIQVRTLVADAMKVNVLRKNKAREWAFADVVFGPSEDHIIQKLITPQFAQTRAAINTQVLGKAGK